MSDSRKTPFVWGTGIAVSLVAYLLSPPLLALAFQSNPPPPPFNTIFMAIYYPAQILYHNAPWYREYIDFACKLLGVRL